MGREFVAFPADLEAAIRVETAKIVGFRDVASPERWTLHGAPLGFYRQAWLACLEQVGPPRSGADAHAGRLYFVVQRHRRGKKLLIVPMANEAGDVDRANRECQLTLSGRQSAIAERVVDYLNFYYAFTPQEDPILANLKEGPTHFAVPMTVDDLRFSDTHPSTRAVDGASEHACSDACLARGAIWHFLEEDDHRRFVAIRLKPRQIPYERISGRIAIQFRDALFAADFRVPSTTGVPVLSNPEPLFQSATLCRPEAYPDTTLPLPAQLSRKEMWRSLKKEVRSITFGLGTAVATGVTWAITLLFACLWLLSALFPIVEMTGWSGMRTVLQQFGQTLGLAAWPETLFGLSIIAIGAFLWSIFYTTHMDKIFNWIFRLSPERWWGWLADELDKRVGQRDKAFIAQDTFRKRAVWALIRLAYWAGYVVLAFASLQIASNIIYNQQAASAVRIVVTLAEQAAINVPLIVYVLLRIPGLLERLDPVGEGILNIHLLFWFHTDIVVVVLKGIYRVWVFTVEASPHAFYRRLPTTRRRLAARSGKPPA